jgi:hypothetical protein
MAQGGRRKAPHLPHSAKSPRSIPTIGQILDKYVQAIGGETAHRKLTSRVMKGTYENKGAGIIGRIEHEAMAPNKLRVTLRAQTKMGLQLDFSNGFDGTVGWEFNPTVAGYRELSGTELAAKRRNAEFCREIKLKELYPKIALRGERKIGASAVYVIEATPAEGDPEIWSFDAQTGLLIRIDDTYFDDYREVDGVKLPFTVRTSSAAGKSIIKFDEIRHNVPIEETRFKNPDPSPVAASTSVKIVTPVMPIPVKGNGQTHLVYEMQITNLREKNLKLNRIEVYAQGNDATPLASLQDEELVSCLAGAGATPGQKDKQVINGYALAFMWLTIDAAATVPTSLNHRLFFIETDASGKSKESVMYGAQVTVRQDTPLVLSSPLHGLNWWAGSGPSNDSFHRRTLLPIDGRAYNPQRFATDWVKLGNNGKPWQGDSSKNENFYGYGAEALAVANGIVSDLKDGLPENTPHSSKRAVPVTLETAAGNYIILDLGNGRFALYAHLQPKSLRVKVGDSVRRGQVLGLVGNSGNASGPHLHFHIVDRNSPLAAEGEPFVFESFEVLGEATMEEITESGWRPQASKPPTKRQNEIPLGNTVVRFP